MTTASQIRPLVHNRPIHRRRMPRFRPKRHAPVHWRPHRTRLYTNRYLALFQPTLPHTIPPSIQLLHPVANAPQANTARDLEVFSKHAGRKAINTDDVMLLTRRNDALETMLKGELEGLREREGRDGGVSGGAAQGKKRGRPSGKGKAKA
jgi:hypothetical protein